VTGTQAPVTLLVRCRVDDYDSWRSDWLAALQVHYERDEVRSFRLWRGADDGNFIVVAEVFESREIADAVVNDPATRETMAAHGVDVSTLEFALVDEVDAGSR
jgi:quinol monooxygenase YgiN